MDRESNHLPTTRMTNGIGPERGFMTPSPVATTQPETRRECESDEADRCIKKHSRSHVRHLIAKPFSLPSACHPKGSLHTLHTWLSSNTMTTTPGNADRRSDAIGVVAFEGCSDSSRDVRNARQLDEDSMPSEDTMSEDCNGEKRLPIILMRRFGSAWRGMNGCTMKMIKIVPSDARNIQSCRPR